MSTIIKAAPTIKPSFILQQIFLTISMVHPIQWLNMPLQNINTIFIRYTFSYIKLANFDTDS
jgi:hypothetical protein